ncbi:4-amino-4-deoxy-L-arabinose-phosphoundecaprenol flippase subunit ArnE [Yersinia pseudotuberculosis]|uniref:Probable 4-amino-4-deoxy-L-arabinose-phosphoundecaprenol flippase subunit ArnE n=1 Tax=Yersinia pseudotuberculosis serotype O:3 (strain YPIII) TaxID=502800 RepID=ARNE_YERPY|nr:4-amino-4-deoxy-L-arabinose-phosphoundecaprenol flippase subunit ArnE [Yersinia pseudotuberculosis]B1JJ33.1 RecName: Full=Probable 4-amino-4-deoxy-L-arabinose-phosphoundecaprenol flippase subunit ArnE; Short=L-Ara4N-phosphoundecaprenol flippase subunit ArnE; AltName: Full=Undecaprenyl phosphate-aminoarabinose flippase subunit ArnE [Yersinia pseudotuberculosis YPIII]AJJ57274.1 small Multidrug Resistance family protein [Yersinia pseudotuberculosis YPIII]AYW87820.1 4-amino-4-deoxy-L-arabinose-ph
MNSYLLLPMVSLLTCIGQLCQKQAAQCWEQPQARRLNLTLRWLAIAVVSLGLGMLLWLRLLQQLPLSVAYPMLSFNFVLVTLAAQLFYGEKATLRHWLGVAAIMFGILLMSWHL